MKKNYSLRSPDLLPPLWERRLIGITKIPPALLQEPTSKDYPGAVAFVKGDIQVHFKKKDIKKTANLLCPGAHFMTREGLREKYRLPQATPLLKLASVLSLVVLSFAKKGSHLRRPLVSLFSFLKAFRDKRGYKKKTAHPYILHLPRYGSGFLLP